MIIAANSRESDAQLVLNVYELLDDNGKEYYFVSITAPGFMNGNGVFIAPDEQMMTTLHEIIDCVHSNFDREEKLKFARYLDNLSKKIKEDVMKMSRVKIK